MLSVILFLVVNLKWVWQLAHHNITFSLCNIVFSAVHWAQMPRLFPPWPLHKAPGGPCASRWRAFLWSLLCCLTKLLSRYSPVFHLHHLLCCVCPKLALGNKCCFVNVLRAGEKKMMLWKNWIFSWICCSRTGWVSFTFGSRLSLHLQGILNLLCGSYFCSACCFLIEAQ